MKRIIFILVSFILFSSCHREESIKADKILQTHNTIMEILNQQTINEQNIEQSFEDCIAQITSSEDVQSADLQDNALVIHHKNGMTSAILFLPENEESKCKTLEPAYKEDIRFSQKNGQKATENIIITNHKVLLWCPFISDFDNPTDRNLYNIFKSSTEINDFQFDVYSNSNCDIASLDNITDYGYVYIETHGMEYKDAFGQKCVALITHQNVMHSDVVYNNNDFMIVSIANYYYTNDEYIQFEFVGDYYSLTNKYFSKKISGTFDKASVVFVSACSGMKNNSLANAFVKDRGAGVFIGFNNIVSQKFASEKAVEFAKKMIENKMDAEQAYDKISIKSDPYNLNWIKLFFPSTRAKILYMAQNNCSPTFFGLNNYITCTEMNKTWNLKEMQYSTGVVTNSWNYLNGKHYRRLVFKGDTINIGTIRLSYNADGSISPGTFSAFNVTNEESEISFETSNDPFIFMTGGWSNEPPRILTIKGPSLWYNIVEGSFTYDTLNSKKKFTFNFITNNGYHFIGQYVE